MKAKPDQQWKTLGLSHWTHSVTDPKSPVGKLKLADLMNYDDRPSYKHRRLWDFHLQWAHSEYKHTSLASVRLVSEVMKSRSPSGKTMSIGHISKGNADLCEWGYLKLLEKGRGTRASRFDINWDLLAIAAAGNFPPSVPHVGNAIADDPSVPHVGNACVPLEDTLEPASVAPLGNKDPSTHTRLEETVMGIDGLECAPPSAPPALAAIAAGTAVPAQGFKGLWSTYDWPHGIKAARDAYKVLAPDADLHARMVGAAKAWREAWARQNNPHAARKSLALWIEEEQYECAPPTIYQKKERAKPAGKADSSVPPAPAAPTQGILPPGTHRFLIAAAEEDGSPFGKWSLDLTLVGVGGKVDGTRYQHRLEVLAEAGHGADHEVHYNLCRLTGIDAPIAFMPGKFVGAFNVTESRIDFARDPAGDRVVEIDAAEVEVDGNDKWARFCLVEPYNGASPVPAGRLDIIVESKRSDLQEEGQARFAKLQQATGIDDVKDTDDFLFTRFTLKADGTFAPAPANDNDDKAIAA